MTAHTAAQAALPPQDAPAAWGLDPLTTGGSLAEAARRWPDAEALVIGDRRATYRQLFEESLERARGLLAIGVTPGQHVGILMPNCWDYVVLFHAIGLAGARALTINARYRDDDLRYVLGNADVELLFIGGHTLPYNDFRTMLLRIHPELEGWRAGLPLSLAAAPKLRSIVNLCDPRETSWPTGAWLDERTALVSREEALDRARSVTAADICLMMFSSGTTARPKACMLTHGSLTRTGMALAGRFRMTERDRIWNPLPFFHMSTMLPMAACRAAGAAVINRAHFEAADGLDELERERATISYASFPTMMSALLAQPDFASRDLSSLRIVHAVGPADLLRRYAAAFPGAFLANGYGLTEASGVPVYSDPADPLEESFRTSGRPFPGVEVRIADPETLAELPQGERGEIWLRGFCIFEGYYKDPAKTAEIMRPDGWLRTGDLGKLDPEGRVIFDGRLKDMLKIGGENVAAVEIESYLCTHPDVQIAQVIPVPDDHLMEVAAAYVELRPGSTLTAAEIAGYCAGRIASYKIPRYVRIVAEWPMSATKVQKYKLPRDFTAAEKIDVRALSAQVKG